ncbi:MAG: carbohydrate binding family 9 domain-containing protein, partial [Gemmatimonadales bacterium]|nr:carbohydrate binding family 9 domain-containing protein [Gemmatimonadales bacterium]
MIDGKLDDPAWEGIRPLTAFLQRNPIEGAAPSESTEVRIAYDDRALFVGFRGFDRTPERVTGRLVRRDQRISADNFTISLDTYDDQRTAFEFSVNPSGARRDVFIYGDGTGRDESWDPVYDWAARRDSLGWSVELRIPFSQLRFASRDSITFGLRVQRSINRRNEEVNWPFFPRDQAGEVSQYGKLVGLVGVPAPRRLELLPYVAGSSTFEPGEEGNPFATGRRSDLRFGGDLKLGLTSSM